MCQLKSSYFSTIKGPTDQHMSHTFLILTYGTPTAKPPLWAAIGSWTNISLCDAAGADSRKSINSKVPLGERMSMNPPLEKVDQYLLSISPPSQNRNLPSDTYSWANEYDAIFIMYYITCCKTIDDANTKSRSNGCINSTSTILQY